MCLHPWPGQLVSEDCLKFCASSSFGYRARSATQKRSKKTCPLYSIFSSDCLGAKLHKRNFNDRKLCWFLIRWYDWWWKQSRPSHDFGRRHWKLSKAKWLAGRCEHWVSLRRICTDELAGSSFRAVRASQESVNELRTSNELWISFFVSKETSQIRKSDPRWSKSMWPSHLFPWNPSRLIVQSCGEGSDLLGRETNKHPKCSDHQNVFASTLGH